MTNIFSSIEDDIAKERNKADQLRRERLEGLFVGQEVEKTPAYRMTTLFVVGTKTSNQIEEALSTLNTKNYGVPFSGSDIEHIFFGANHSLTRESWKGSEDVWTSMIRKFLDKNYLCSLDIPVDLAEEVLETYLNEHNNFIPQIRVTVPYVGLWNYNTMVKIDDKGFNESNPGVWCHSLHDLCSRETFTDWREYKGDKNI